MTELDISELIQLLQNESASIDAQFQMWTSITFAVLIAVFVAGAQFSLRLKIFIASTYALAVSVILIRYANDASQFALFRNALAERGFEYPAIADLRTLRATLYLCGSLASVIFIFANPRNPVQETKPADIDVPPA